MRNLRHSCPITQSEGAKTFVTRLYSLNAINVFLIEEKPIPDLVISQPDLLGAAPDGLRDSEECKKNNAMKSESEIKSSNGGQRMQFPAASMIIPKKNGAFCEV